MEIGEMKLDDRLTLTREMIADRYPAAANVVREARAEITRLTAALGAARAERDAAYSVIKQVSAVLHAPQTMPSDEQVAHEYRLIYDIVLTYEDGVDTAPQPAAAPAVDAAPVGDTDNLTNAQKWLDDDIFGTSLIAVRKAVQSLILHMQNGGTQS